MPWYVFALVDEVPARPLGRGLSGPLRARPSGGAFAIVERRSDVPPAELGSMRAHHNVVSRLSKRVPAILPVRFGTLLDDEGLDEALADRNKEIAHALGLVRHRVQFTWRTGPSMAGGASSSPRSSMTLADASGAAYLRRAAKAATAAPPSAFRMLRDRLRAFVVREKFQPASTGTPATLYQLIDKTAVDRYAAMADALILTHPALTVSGPWPPFAFAAELL